MGTCLSPGLSVTSLMPPPKEPESPRINLYWMSKSRPLDTDHSIPFNPANPLGSEEAIVYAVPEADALVTKIQIALNEVVKEPAKGRLQAPENFCSWMVNAEICPKEEGIWWKVWAENLRASDRGKVVLFSVSLKTSKLRSAMRRTYIRVEDESGKEIKVARGKVESRGCLTVSTLTKEDFEKIAPTP